MKVLTSAVNTPEEYKLCVVCGNIVEKSIIECNYCSAYRFETDPEQVSNAALDLARHPNSSVTETECLHLNDE